jgi:hypothetical protein
MSDYPIIFSAPMVQALLAGRKTQTRRLAWRQWIDAPREYGQPPSAHTSGFGFGPTIWQRIQPGDRLWVRESWRIGGWEDCGMVWLRYPADNAGSPWLQPDDSDALIERVCDELDRAGVPLNAEGNYTSTEKLRTRSAVAMPRWASRITLTVTEVRRQRLSDITDADALAEGIVEVQSELNGTPYRRYLVPGVEHRLKEFPELSRETAREMYAAFWDTLHGSGEWLKDPEVVAISFRAALGNIDQFGKLAK